MASGKAWGGQLVGFHLTSWSPGPCCKRCHSWETIKIFSFGGYFLLESKFYC